jgi:hypothetical protein
MTLKEKFHQWLRTDPFNSRDRVTLREAQLEVIADEFAIGFAEWVLKNYDGVKSVKELLEIYKKEQGL